MSPVAHVRRGAQGRPGGNLLLPEADPAVGVANEPVCQQAQVALSSRWAAGWPGCNSGLHNHQQDRTGAGCDHLALTSSP